MHLLLILLELLWIYATSWIRCPWCGGWWPLFGKGDYGPRQSGECKHCGRMI